jgi:thymidylate synthase
MEKKGGVIPVLSVSGRNIPEAYYNAIKAVHENGYELRTQYDRKNKDGSFLDPPGKDARVMVEVKDLFAQPRYPVLSFSERGKYIAEVLGAKDHLVVSHEKLLKAIHSGDEFNATEWPYCYHQRLTAYPSQRGPINQLELAVDRLAKDPLTRRAIITTRLPEVDSYLAEDIPCLGEMQFRAIENEDGGLVLNTFARWRSRDLYKAWGDNLIGLSHLIKNEVALPLEEKTGKKVILGPYSEENGSLHIYGQDYSSKGANSFLDRFPDSDSFVKRAWDSERAKELVLPELNLLKAETTWNFPKESIDLIDKLIRRFESGELII